MVFSSQLFIFYFLPACLLLYTCTPRAGKQLVLTLCSYLFYGWANPLFVVLMLFSTVIDYFAGLAIAQQWGRPWKEPVVALENGGTRTTQQKVALATSIVTNLSLLGFFKYFNFAVENYDAVLRLVGLQELQLDTVMRVTLPLGISFYTFQSMSYSIDVYRGHARAMRNPVTFACYVSMFPQLVAGPIIRYQEIAEQLLHRSHTVEKFARGAAFFCLGLGKKVLLANPCGKIADTVFDAGSANAVDSWFGVVAYAFQIYFDFSGYSDMAIGLGLMFGFVFAKNFDSPYLSQSITEFWRRWHISLSTWLRDYLYLPLGGNRRGRTRTYVNLAVVMLLGGLWHGAAWNFMVWGGIHGGMLALERAQGKESFYRKLPGPLRLALTFVIVLFAWVFFRAPTLDAALSYCAAMLGLSQAQPGAILLGGILYQPYYWVTLLMAGLVVFTAPQTWDFTRRLSATKCFLIGLVFAVSLVLLSLQGYNPFIYFIF